MVTAQQARDFRERPQDIADEVWKKIESQLLWEDRGDFTLPYGISPEVRKQTIKRIREQAGQHGWLLSDFQDERHIHFSIIRPPGERSAD